MTLVDELQIYMKAGNGGDGVVRWRREKFIPKGGPSGGDGGRGGDIYVRAVRDISLLARYRHKDKFRAEDGEAGRVNSKKGKSGNDIIIDVPVGSVITNIKSGKRFELLEEGEVQKILRGGDGGLGNEHFKSSTNQRPQQSTQGEPGEDADMRIELELIADVGFIGFPNAGKSTLLNMLTNAHAKTGGYAFTTLSPNLGEFHGYTLADLPGLIEGAATGKGLGIKFLKHIKRTKILAHCISLENKNIIETYKNVRKEIGEYEKGLLDKPEIILLTKSDLVDENRATEAQNAIISHTGRATSVVSMYDDSSRKAVASLISQSLLKS